MNDLKQSYSEQPNPPTVANEGLAAQTLWACVASEVGYGEYDTEVSLVDKIGDLETAISGKADSTHTHHADNLLGLANVAKTGNYSDINNPPNFAAVATSGDYNDLNNKPTAYSHPASHPASMITGLSDVATSGSYNDLTDKPNIPTVPSTLPANGGNADTVDNMHASEFATAGHTHSQYAGATHGHAAGEITGLSDVATSGSYDDLTDKPTIPTVPASLPANGGNADTVDNKHASDFAAASHTHSQYASSSHSHAAGNITGLSDVATSGSYDDLTEKPTSMTPTAHVHAQTDVTGLEAALSGKASQTHTHAQADVTGLSTALSGKANASHSHAQSEVTGLEDALAGKSNTNHTHNYAAASHNHTLDNITETTDKKVFTATERTKLAGVANGANNYVHPDTHAASMITGLATVATSGKYSDLTGKPTAMTPEAHTHAQADVTGLTAALSGKANSTHSHAISGVTGLSDALNGKANTSHAHQIFSSVNSVSSYKLIYISTTGDDNNNGFSQTAPMATIKGVLKKYADTYKSIDIRLADGTYTENLGSIAIDSCNLSIRSISEDKDKVTLNMTTALEFCVTEARMYNMTVNVTVTGVRTICVNGGVFYAYNVRFNVPTDSNSSCINVYNGSSAFLMNCVINSGTGSTTGYCVYGNQAMQIKAINCTSERTVAGAFYAHNGTDIIYSDTITATKKTRETFYGRCIQRTQVEGNLWSDDYYMAANQTATPSKKLSECRTGWLLLWSDYDEDTSTANDGDFVTSVIPNKKPDGSAWNGETFYCDVPRHIGSDTSDVTTERRIMKRLRVYDNKLTGFAENSLSDRKDVVLRAIREI